MRWLVVLLLVGVLFISGCGNSDVSVRDVAVDKCVSLCLAAREANISLVDGPCLSDNNSLWGVPDYVCDVAHYPRLPIDNLPENQCRDYRLGLAHHFVEVSPDCRVIRVY